MINLNLQELIACGDNRKCYLHANNKNLCIKVLHNDKPIKIQLREKQYYNSLIKRKVSWDRLSKMTQVIKTNQGIGLIFEVVRDFDGQISQSLDYYLQLNDPQLNKVIIQEIEKLKDYLYREAIVFRDLITLNILLQKINANTYKAIIIDGIGHNDFIPICNYSKTFSRRKIIRIWNRKKSHWFDKYPSIKDEVLLFNKKPTI